MIKLMTKVRTVSGAQDDDSDSDIQFENTSFDESSSDSHNHSLRVIPSTRLVSTKQSPQFKAFYRQYPVNITFDTGAEISMIKSSVAQLIGAVFKLLSVLCRSR